MRGSRQPRVAEGKDNTEGKNDAETAETTGTSQEHETPERQKPARTPRNSSARPTQRMRTATDLTGDAEERATPEIQGMATPPTIQQEPGRLEQVVAQLQDGQATQAKPPAEPEVVYKWANQRFFPRRYVACALHPLSPPWRSLRDDHPA